VSERTATLATSWASLTFLRRPVRDFERISEDAVSQVVEGGDPFSYEWEGFSVTYSLGTGNPEG
jgi:hypothetical protein